MYQLAWWFLLGQREGRERSADSGQCWPEAALEVSGTVWARVALLWAALGGLQEPRALQGGLSLEPRREAGQAAEEGEPRDNQTGTRWKGNRRAGKGRC